MSNVGTLFGWLGDIVGTHAFNDEVPVALRRRWNLVGFTIADDAVNEWLTVTVTPSLVDGDSSITVGDLTGIDLVAGDGANVDIQSTTGNVTVAAGTGAGDTCALTGYAVTCTGTNSFTASAPAVIVTSTTSTLITSETTLNLGTSDANTINIGDAGVAVNIDGTVLVNGAPIAGSDLDPNGTLNIANSLTDILNLGSSTCVSSLLGSSVAISAAAVGGVSIETTSGGPINIVTAGGAIEINSDAEPLTLTSNGGTTLLTGVTTTVEGTTTEVTGSTAARVLAPTIVIGRTVAANRETHTLSGSSHVRTVTDNANATALTETCLAAGSTIAAAGTLTCSGTTSGFSGSAATNLGTTAGNTVTLSTATSTLTVNAATYNTASTTFSAYALGTMTLQAYGTTLSLQCDSRVINIGNVAGTTRIQDRFPVAVTPGSAAATAIGAVTVPANTSGEWEGVLDLRNGATNHEIYDVSFSFNSDGTTVTSRDLSVVIRGTTQGTIGTVVGDVTKGDAGLVVTISCANASGIKTALTGRGRWNS